MDDLISRQAAIKILMTVKTFNPSIARCVGVDWCIEAINALPPAQPERKKGHWIEVNDNYNRISGRCSVCGWESHMYEDDVVGMDFCPNCGERLDEKGGEVWSK